MGNLSERNNSAIENGNSGDRSVPATSVPLWQRISGIEPKRETDMDVEAREAGIRRLLKEVETRAAAEIERGEAGKIPEGERTCFWDPLARICWQLGISRTKLSSYSRELTGMRAHEITDRIFARRVLKVRLQKYVEGNVSPALEGWRKVPGLGSKQKYEVTEQMIGMMRDLRFGVRRAGFAAGLGFANYSRLSRACLLAFGVSIDELEAQIVCTLVQKFFGSPEMKKVEYERMKAEAAGRLEQFKKRGIFADPIELMMERKGKMVSSL